MHPLAPQIEKAIGKAHVLRIFGLGIDRKRQRLGLREDLYVGDGELDLAGVELGVDRIGRAGGDPPGHRDHAFEPQRVRRREERRRDIDHALRDAVMIAQIDKKELSMIALAMHPPGQPRRLAGIGQAQGSASVGSVGVHQGKSCSRRRENGTPARGCQAGHRSGTAPNGIKLSPQ